LSICRAEALFKAAMEEQADGIFPDTAPQILK
jgi:hypothetical protein